MCMQNESLFGTVLNTIRTQDSANLADIDADNTAALNDPTAALDPLADDPSLIKVSALHPSASQWEEHAEQLEEDALRKSFTDTKSTFPNNSLSFDVAADDEEHSASVFPTPRGVGRDKSQGKLASESSKQADSLSGDAGGHGVAPLNRSRFGSVHAGQDPSTLSVDSGHLDSGAYYTFPVLQVSGAAVWPRFVACKRSVSYSPSMFWMCVSW